MRRAKRAKDLKVGDRIRIIRLPGGHMHRDTKSAYKKLIARNRSVRISHFDKYGDPWFRFRFRLKDGRWEYHGMIVLDDDNNWIAVRPRKKRR